MRKTKTAHCPGGVPEDIFALPQLTGEFYNVSIVVGLLLMLSDFLESENYLCAVDPELYGEAYEQLAPVPPSFYSLTFEEAAQSFFDLLNIDINDINSSNCVRAYKCFVAAVEFRV